MAGMSPIDGNGAILMLCRPRAFVYPCTPRVSPCIRMHCHVAPKWREIRPFYRDDSAASGSIGPHFCCAAPAIPLTP